MNETQREPVAPEAGDSAALARCCADLLYEQKCKDLKILDVRESLQIIDYFVIATGLNSRHLRSSADYLLKELKAQAIHRLGAEGHRDGKWVLIDFDEVVVHLFLEESRKFYDLELLWGDSEKLDWQPPARPESAAAATAGDSQEGAAPFILRREPVSEEKSDTSNPTSSDSNATDSNATDSNATDTSAVDSDSVAGGS